MSISFGFFSSLVAELLIVT